MNRLYCIFSKTGFGTLRPKELWGSLFDLWFLVPMTGILIDSESGGDAHSLGRNFLYLGSAYLLSAILFKTPLPLQPLKVWAFLFLILHPTPLIASISAALLGLLLFLSGRLGVTDALSEKLDDAAIRSVKRAVSIYVYIVGAISLGLWLLHHVPGIDLSRFPGSIRGNEPQSPGSLLDLLLLVLPQLPVTLLNGVLATVREKQATETLSETSRRRLTGDNTSCWLGLANLLAGALGLLPFCHGSGGLRSYRKYGIRTIFPSLCSSSVLIVLGVILARGNFILPKTAFFAIFLAGFLFAEYLITRKEAPKNGSRGMAQASHNKDRSPLGVWILSGGMLSGLVAFGGIPAVLVFLLGMNTFMTLSKSSHSRERVERQGTVVTCTAGTSIPEKVSGAAGQPETAERSAELSMEKTFHGGNSCCLPPESGLLGATDGSSPEIHSSIFPSTSPLFSNPAILASSPVRGDPKWIPFIGDLDRRPQETTNRTLTSLLFLFFFFFFPFLNLSGTTRKATGIIPAARETVFSGPTRIRAP
ncbi:MAG: molybdate transporter family protein [Leptospirillum sp.]